MDRSKTEPVVSPPCLGTGPIGPAWGRAEDMAKLRIIARIGQEGFMFVRDVVFVVVVE